MNEIPKVPEKTLEQIIQELTLELDDLFQRRDAAINPVAKKALATMISIKMSQRSEYQMRQLSKNANKPVGEPGGDSH